MAKAFPRHTINLDTSAYVTYFKLWKDMDLTSGTNVLKFEKAFAEYIGAVSCVAMSSARAAFYVTMKALAIGRGDEVIMPAYTFPSMPAAVVAIGAIPVFVDVDPETFNIDPALAAAAVTPKTKAIVAAHLFGQAAEVESLAKTAKAANAFLIEDCAHSTGVFFHGKHVGSWGDAGLFSFGIGKNMPCFGGGAVTFKDRDLSGKVRKLVNSFSEPEDMSIHKKVWGSIPGWLLTRPESFPWTFYIVARMLSSMGSDAMDASVEEPISETTHFSLRSVNKMANLQATVGIEQLTKLRQRNATLARNGAYLAEKLQGIPTVQAPKPVAGEEHIYQYFRILVPEAGRFRSLLLKRGVDTKRDDMRDCSGLAAFSAFKKDCPVAADLPDKSIELPNNVFLTQGDIDYIASAVREVADIVSRTPADAATSGRS